ncbi:hypothetical protein [Nocardia colli]|uniref:hypothetical protein n=1 Tax=Nocardia colli TaxID=2545717 RepID=UPI0035DB0459
MRPRLDPAVRYVACPEGVYLFGDRGARTLRGARAFDWLSRLEPYLNGELTLDELTAALPAEQRATVEGMVTALHEHGFLTDAQADLPHRLSVADQGIYAREIAFLACAIDSPEHRFERHREGRVTVFGGTGTEAVVTAVVAAGVRSGWADVRVVATEQIGAGLARATEAARRDERQRVLSVAALSTADLCDTDVVLQIDSAADELAAFADACPDGVSLGQMLIETDEAWISEVGAPADSAACWKRLRANRKAAGASGANRWISGPVPAVLAAHLVLGSFRYRTGLAALPAPSGPRVARLDLRTLDLTTHSVAPIHAAAERDPRAADGPIAATPDDLLARAGGLVDQYTGVLSVLDEGNLTQFPLALCRAVVSDPAAVIPAEDALAEVVGWGPDQRVARTRTVLRALAVYAWLSVDAAETTTGIDLVTGETRTLSTSFALDGASLVGVAAGLTQADAIAWGLRQQCESLLVERRAVWMARPALDAGRMPLDEAGIRLLHQLDLAGCRASVADLGDILGVPAYVVRTEHGDEVVSCAATAPDAIRAGLERALVAWQGHPSSCSAATVATSEDPGLLAKALSECGFAPVVQLLDSDVTLVHAVRVVLDGV